VSSFEAKMPRLVAELHAQFVCLLSLWERPGEGACLSAKPELAIKANLRGLGYGG
jgi:hypothetical protein